MKNIQNVILDKYTNNDLYKQLFLASISKTKAQFTPKPDKKELGHNQKM